MPTVLAVHLIKFPCKLGATSAKRSRGDMSTHALEQRLEEAEGETSEENEVWSGLTSHLQIKSVHLVAQRLAESRVLDCHEPTTIYIPKPGLRHVSQTIFP